MFGRALSRTPQSTYQLTGTTPTLDLLTKVACLTTQAVEPWAAAALPIARATTPPSSWYTSPDVLKLEEQTVFRRNWQAVGRVEQVAAPGAYFTGSLLNTHYIVCRDANNKLRAFHNVCRHHAAAVASDSGTAQSFQCPYHGWTYGLDGRLQKATRLKGIENFKAADFGLWPILVDTWGPFVFLRFDKASDPQQGGSLGVEGWLGTGSRALQGAGIADNMTHVRRLDYLIHCNWKVYCDNYLDGGYHVPHAHPALAAGVDMTSYQTEIFGAVSIQSVEPAGSDERLAGGPSNAAYAFIYPNFMINRYGPWLDTNLVMPVDEKSCVVVFDYFLDPGKVTEGEDFIDAAVAASGQVQEEDIELCEAVQRGLTSTAYDVGRYAPSMETPMYHFHQLLHHDLTSSVK